MLTKTPTFEERRAEAEKKAARDRILVNDVVQGVLREHGGVHYWAVSALEPLLLKLAQDEGPSFEAAKASTILDEISRAAKRMSEEISARI